MLTWSPSLPRVEGYKDFCLPRLTEDQGMLCSTQPVSELVGPRRWSAPFPLCHHPVHPSSRAGAMAGRRWVLWHHGPVRAPDLRDCGAGEGVCSAPGPPLPALCAPCPSHPAQLSYHRSCSPNVPWLCCLGQALSGWQNSHLEITCMDFWLKLTHACGFAFTTNF